MKWCLFSILMGLLLTHSTVTAQNINNTGSIINTGTIKVRQSANNLPGVINGTIELTGNDQSLPAKQYQNVLLSGTGTKTSAGGNFSIQNNLTIAAAVTLQIPKGTIITLGGTLFESGIMRGAIQRSVDLTGSTTSSNFGNIGATITWSSNAPGMTSILRASDSVQVGQGNQSVKRYYQIQSTDATATGTVTFKYADDELNGHTASNLQLWRSVDNGVNWQRYEPVVDTLLKTITKPNVTLAGRWAIADTVRALGPLLGAAGIPVSIASASSVPAEQVILTTVDTLKVRITDIFGTPVGNVPVKFMVMSLPLQAVGTLLSDTSVTTNVLGIASTLFTLGSKVGDYEVIATAPNLDTVRMKTKARHGLAQTLASVAVTQQVKPILTQLDTLFTVTVADIGGNPVDSAQVQFGLVNLPGGSFGEMLSVVSAKTDSLGRASTQLTLGSKVSTYTVKANVTGIADSATFTATATTGAPNVIAALSITQQNRPILTKLDTAFTITVADTGGNPVDSALVQFAIVARPAGSAGDSLSVTSAYTDALGKASTFLTLGNKLGQYSVSAKAIGITDSVTFAAIAKSGLPKQLAAMPISLQTKQILTQLDSAFTVTVSDNGGNPVENALVHFRIASVPSGATDTALSVRNALTDSLGHASTTLTLGAKVGLYRVHALMSGITDTAKFSANATAGNPASIARSFGDAQSGVNGQALLSPFVVTVLDQGGNPVKDDTVEFKLQANAFGAVLSKTIVPTDALGQASSVLTLGTRSGPYAVSAQSRSLPGALQFSANALPGAAASLAQVQGNNQSATIGNTLGSDFVVHIVDANGNSVPNDTVFFSIDSLPNVNATGQLLTNSSVITDTSGLASTRFTLGNKTGDYIVNASVRNIPVVSFRVNAKAGAASSFAELSGTNQSTVIATQLPNEFVMRVTDIGGNSVSGTTVQFTITSAPANAVGQRLNSSTALSDANGLARVSFTAGNKVGTYTIRASSAGVPDTVFTATATHGAASAMMVSSGLGQTRPILTILDSFSVRILDIGENAVPLKNVQFSIIERPAGDTSASLSTLVSDSDSSGIAGVTLTLGSKIGAYRVKATITTPAPFEAQKINGKETRREASAAAVIETTFTAFATHGAAAVFADILGNEQINPTATTLDTSFILTVKDIGGNLVPNADVKFAIVSVPANAAGQQLRDTMVTTDSLGTASTVLTLGSHEGLYTVAASVNGSLSTLFTANAFYIYGDPNNDVNINVADITTIIDRITGRRTFSFVDSLKADLNKDGLIDTADVNTLVRTILDRPSVFATLPPFIPERATTGKDVADKNASPEERTFYSEAKTQFESTPQGLRLNMENTVPVRGIEVRIRLKDSSVTVNNANYLFARAQQMNVVMRTVNNEVRMLAYSLKNDEIQPGSGTIIRIPKITGVNQFDSTEVILSVGANVAVTPEALVVTAAPGKYPTAYSLEQNYPNPFNGLTTIQYDIPDVKTSETKVAIQIFNVLGQKVKTLINTPHDPGQYRITWNGTDESGSQVSSGIYFYRLITKNHLTTKKMIYVK